MSQIRERVLWKQLPALKSSVGLARTYVGSELYRLGFLDAVEDAQLIVSELVSNALAVTPPLGVVVLYLGQRSRGMVLGVMDAGAAAPVIDNAMPVVDARSIAELPDDPGGWGLPIVRAPAREVWAEPARPGPGKWVCATLNV